jgi:hypothetical protein
MTEGSKVIWELPNGGQSITKIIRAVVQKELKIALNVSSWEVKPNEGDVAYNYQLKEKGDSTLLRIEIGDFSLIKDGKMHYDASVEFASDSKQIIKKLSENLGNDWLLPWISFGCVSRRSELSIRQLFLMEL